MWRLHLRCPHHGRGLEKKNKKKKKQKKSTFTCRKSFNFCKSLKFQVSTRKESDSFFFLHISFHKLKIRLADFVIFRNYFFCPFFILFSLSSPLIRDFIIFYHPDQDGVVMIEEADKKKIK